jgi:hypothetical protein
MCTVRLKIFRLRWHDDLLRKIKWLNVEQEETEYENGEGCFSLGRFCGPPSSPPPPPHKGIPPPSRQFSRYPTSGGLPRCCYITLDSAMAASQNGFCSYKLSIHKKTNIIQISTKNIKIFIYLIFYHREIVKLQ